MFRRVTSLSLISFFLIACLWITHLCFIRESDYSYYQTLQVQKAKKSEPSYSSTHQWRKNSCKDIWLTQDNEERLHHKIKASSSILTIIPKNNKFEIVESLNGLTCWMQDKLYEMPETHDKMQQLRFIEANEGSFSYRSQEFNAQNASVFLFRLPGYLLQENLMDKQKAFLRGIAKEAFFSISGKNPHFQAKQFKATFIKNE